MKKLINIMMDPAIILAAAILALSIMGSLNSCVTVTRDPAAFTEREHR